MGILFFDPYTLLSNEYKPSILLNLSDVGVMLGDGHSGFVIFGPHFRFDVEIGDVLSESHLADAGRHKLISLLTSCVVHIGDNFKHFVRVSAYDAKHSCRLDSLLAAGIGDRHTLDVLDHVARAGDPNVVGHLAELAIGLGGGVCDRDRLSAAHCRHKLFFQDGCIVL